MFEPFLKCMKDEYVLESLHGTLESFSESISHLNFPLPVEQIDVINELLALLVAESQTRRQKREDVRKSADFDEEEGNTIENENASEDEFLGYVFLCVSKVIKNCGAVYVPSFHKHLFPHFFPLLHPDVSNGQRVAALCIFDDIVLYGGKPGAVYVDKLFPIVLNDCKSENADIRQAALFGVGACAQVAGPAFAPHIPVGLAVLIAAVEEPAEIGEDQIGNPTDNAISSVGRIINCHGELLSQTDNPTYHLSRLLPLWLSWLPIRNDGEEAQFVHALLCTFVESNNPCLLGPNNSNLSKIVSVFGDVMGTELVDADTSNRIIKICQRIAQILAPKPLAELFFSLSQKQQKNLAPYLQPQ